MFQLVGSFNDVRTPGSQTLGLAWFQISEWRKQLYWTKRQ